MSRMDVMLFCLYFPYSVYLSVNGEDLSMARTVSQVTEVRLTSSGALGKTED